MSATLADLDFAPVSISAEARGLARDLRRRIAVEDPIFDRAVDELLEPVRTRLARYPHRSLRQEALAELITGWMHMQPRDWRMDLHAKLDKRKATLCEYRLVAGEMRKPNDPNWVGHEDDVAAIQINLVVNRSSVHLRSHCVCTFSLHALARRYQRTADSDDAAVLHDCLIAARIDVSTLGAGGYKITTDAHGGGWRGRTIRQRGPDDVVRRVISIRTWLPS